MELENRVELIEAMIAETLARVDEREVAAKERHEKLMRDHHRHYVIVTSLEVVGVWAIVALLFFGV